MEDIVEQNLAVTYVVPKYFCLQADFVSPVNQGQCEASVLTGGTTFILLRCSVTRISQNQANEDEVPDSPDNSEQDSDAHGQTRLRRSWGISEEE